MFLIDKNLLKFLIVGLINTMIGAGIMFLLYNLIHLNYWISSACNYIIGGVCSYFLNKYFTFSNHEKSIKQIIIFILNLIICYILAYFFAKKIIYILLFSQTEKTRANVAMFCGMFLYTLLNYIGQRLIVFAKKEKNE